MVSTLWISQKKNLIQKPDKNCVIMFGLPSAAEMVILEKKYVRGNIAKKLIDVCILQADENMEDPESSRGPRSLATECILVHCVGLVSVVVSYREFG